MHTINCLYFEGSRLVLEERYTVGIRAFPKFERVTPQEETDFIARVHAETQRLLEAKRNESH